MCEINLKCEIRADAFIRRKIQHVNQVRKSQTADSLHLDVAFSEVKPDQRLEKLDE